MKTRNFNNKFLRGIWFNTPPDGVEIMDEAHVVYAGEILFDIDGKPIKYVKVFKIVDEWKFYAISVEALYEAVLNGNSVDCTEVVPRIEQVVKYEKV
jgi:hypothetical protein